MQRRTFSKAFIGSLTSYSLFESLFASQAFSSSISPIIKHWAIELETYCQDLQKGSISIAEWQDHIDRLYKKISLDELLAFIKFDQLTKGFSYPDLGVDVRYVKFPQLSGLPSRTTFVKKIFGMQKGRAIIPHGHSNMVSAHLILKGEMHLRNYHKIKQEPNHLIISPSLDTQIKTWSELNHLR